MNHHLCQHFCSEQNIVFFFFFLIYIFVSSTRVIVSPKYHFFISQKQGNHYCRGHKNSFHETDLLRNNKLLTTQPPKAVLHPRIKYPFSASTFSHFLIPHFLLHLTCRQPVVKEILLSILKGSNQV